MILLVDYLRQHRAWGWLQLVRGSSALDAPPGLRFAKVMGSGQGGGFGLRPSATHQGLVCVFNDRGSAERFCSGAGARAFIDRAREHWMGMLDVTSSRGAWDQHTWAVSPDLEGLGGISSVAGPGPVASLTRASIRPSSVMAFWRHAPAAQADLATAPGCELAVGLGEAPLVRQCTFSLWEDEDSMVRYAHTGAHRRAVASAYRHEFFSESMFVRMRVLAMEGQWQGRAFKLMPGELRG
ncbi:MAG: hypothetical protein FGM55_05710 [Rhodoferax sp.]|nr:hypothetical protein [Rhodoferax sp.]